VRCQRTTVCGCTITSTERQLCHSLESSTQNQRSCQRNFGLGVARCSVANCCLRARFSAANPVRLTKRARNHQPMTFSMFLWLILGRIR
jgi:hypothetical protein